MRHYKIYENKAFDVIDAFNNSVGQITYGIDSGQSLIERTLGFVCQELPGWRDAPDRASEIAENRLTHQLCKYLNVRASSEFPMVHFAVEEPQSIGSVDLSASPTEQTTVGARTYSRFNSLIVIECKRLPAPKVTREKEYVTGELKNSGGIQRFKLGRHGADSSLAAMIGYVQSGTVDEWEKLLNSWIADLASGTLVDNCTWKAVETLQLFSCDRKKRVFCYRSKHHRSSPLSLIELRHFWIEMT